MSEVKRYYVGKYGLVEGEALGRISVVLGADADRLRAELECSRGDFAQLERICDALQKRLTAADERVDVLEGLLRMSLIAMKRIYLAGEDRIIELGGDCDSAEMMMQSDPAAMDICAALNPAGAQRNQCDGCQAGIPVVSGAHRMGKPGGYPDTMSCTAKLYKP